MRTKHKIVLAILILIALLLAWTIAFWHMSTPDEEKIWVAPNATIEKHYVDISDTSIRLPFSEYKERFNESGFVIVQQGWSGSDILVTYLTKVEYMTYFAQRQYFDFWGTRKYVLDFDESASKSYIKLYRNRDFDSFLFGIVIWFVIVFFTAFDIFVRQKREVEAG